MKGKCVGLYMTLFIFLFLGSKSVDAASLCLRKGLTLGDVITSTSKNIGGYYEVCSWYKDKMKKKRILQADLFASAFTYMMWKNLKDSEWPKDRELAWKYLQFSIEVALKNGITVHKHLSAMHD